MKHRRSSKYLPPAMVSSQVRPSSQAETEKDDNAIEKHQQSQSSLLTLPEPGSQERLRAERQLVRKLDTRVLPVVFIITIMNYIDVCSLLPHYRHPQN
jgi:hypothetical protein